MSKPWLWLGRAVSASCGAALVAPLGNPLVTLAGAAAGLALPARLAHWSRLRARRRLRAALGPALTMLARLAEAHPHPYRVLQEAAPRVPAPLGPELNRALAEHRAGVALDDALRRVAHRLDEDFYLHQVADLTGIAIRQGGGLAAPLTRLLDRFWQAQELEAEAAVELFGYGWLTLGLFLFSLLPLPLALAAGGPQADYLLHSPGGQRLLAWVVWSGMAVAALPGWLSSSD